MEEIVFAHKSFFLILLVFIPMIGWYVWRQREKQASIQISTTNYFNKASRTYKHYLIHVPFVLRLITITMLVIILARPQSENSWENSTTKGIDIVIALDISSSMIAEDFKPNRIEAAKDVAIQFINGRPTDRIGLVIFAAESFTQCPLTTDHAVLINLFKDIKSGMVEDGTAIGLGLATAINRLKESNAISKTIILLTDGVNNTGEIAPLTAAEIAKTFGIRVYTIGIGTMGTAPYPVQTPFGVQYQSMPVEIDEVLLRQIAQMTNGKYYRATGNQKLHEIYGEIDKLEKSKIEVKKYSKKQEKFLIFAVLAAISLLLEILLKNTVLKNIP